MRDAVERFGVMRIGMWGFSSDSAGASAGAGAAGAAAAAADGPSAADDGGDDADEEKTTLGIDMGVDDERRVTCRPAARKRGSRLFRMQVLKASRCTSHTRSFLEMKKWNSWLGWAMERIWSEELMRYLRWNVSSLMPCHR